MKTNKNKTRLYFRSKRFNKNVYSSEIFDNPPGKYFLSEFDSTARDDELKYRRYGSIEDILNDADSFVVCTADSFTKKELNMIQDVIFANGRHIYGNDRVIQIVHKIEQMLLKGAYLPDDENDIIKK